MKKILLLIPILFLLIGCSKLDATETEYESVYIIADKLSFRCDEIESVEYIENDMLVVVCEYGTFKGRTENFIFLKWVVNSE